MSEERNEGMQDYDMDLAGAEAASALGGFDPIPPDQYTARVNIKELGASKGGYPQVVQEWQVVEGEYTGRTVREWVVFGPKSAPFIKARFVGLGLAMPTTTLKATAVAAYYAREAQGKVALITVSNEERGDKVYNTVINISSAFRLGGGPVGALAPGGRGGSISASELHEEDVPF